MPQTSKLEEKVTTISVGKKKISAAQLGRIGVLMGGYSSEREISLKSGNAIIKALKEAGCDVHPIDITCRRENEIANLIKEAKIDVAFIALHGCLGEDGTIQTILENLSIPYSGSGVKASQLAINKITTQAILKQKGIPIAENLILRNTDEIGPNQILEKLKLPVVVKPACEGSSIGVTVVFEKENLALALQNAFRYGKEVLIERYIKGREFTVGIFDGKALPIVEVVPKNQVFDFSAKYTLGMTKYIVPAQIAAAVAQNMQTIGLQAHQALGCRHFSRIDMMLEDETKPYVLEVNTIPGFTATSLLPKAAQAVGIDFTQLCLQMIRLAYGQKE